MQSRHFPPRPAVVICIREVGYKDKGQQQVREKSGSPTLPLRFWWTESPLKSAQKSTRESRSTQKRALESKCTRLSAQKSAQTSSTAQTRAQRIALKSKSLKRVLKRVCYSIKCSGEWATQKSEPLKRVRYS